MVLGCFHVNYYLSKAARKFLHVWRVGRYRHHFDECGSGFDPQGKVVIVNEGTLRVGRNFTMRSFAFQPIQIRIGREGNLTIGDVVIINQGARINCSKEIVIGNHCQIGDEVIIMDNDWHGVGERLTRTESTKINDNVWIATRAIILRGVTLGEGCVVAAGAVVTRPVDAFTLVGGVPAQPIRMLNLPVVERHK